MATKPRRPEPRPAVRPPEAKSSTTSVVKTDHRLSSDRAAENERNAADRAGTVSNTDARHPAASLPDSARSPVGGSARDPLDQELKGQAEQRENVLVDKPQKEREVVDAILNSLTGIKNNLPASGEMTRQQIDQLDKALGDIVRDFSSKKISDKITRNA